MFLSICMRNAVILHCGDTIAPTLMTTAPARHPSHTIFGDFFFFISSVRNDAKPSVSVTGCLICCAFFFDMHIYYSNSFDSDWWQPRKVPLVLSSVAGASGRTILNACSQIEFNFIYCDADWHCAQANAFGFCQVVCHFNLHK